MADEELMQLAGQGNVQAYELIYDRHSTAAFSLAYRVCGSRSLAEEATQEAMLSIWRCADRYSAAAGSVRSWLLTVVHRRAVDQVRRASRLDTWQFSDEACLQLLPASNDTSQEALLHMQRQQVQEHVNSLPAEQQRVVQLSFYGGFSHSEIAEMLEIPLGTVKSRMRLGLNHLSGQLNQEAMA